MSQKQAITLIPIGLVLGVAIITATIFLLKGKDASAEKVSGSQPIVDVSELQFGLEWGCGRAEVEMLMEEQGYEMSKSAVDTMISYSVDDFCGIDGANGYVAFVFSGEDKLRNVQYGFTSEEAGGACNGETINYLIESIEKELNENYEKCSAKLDVEDYEYWLGEKTFVTYISEDSVRVVLAYTDCASEPGLVEYLRNLQ